MNWDKNLEISANLLYENKEWKNPEFYKDVEAVKKDLQLDILFNNSGREQELTEGTVQTFVENDPFLENALSKVMTVPLKSADEIYYRQEIMKDFFHNEKLLKAMYSCMKKANARWEAVGKDLYKKNGRESGRGTLITKIQILQLYISNLATIKELLLKYEESITSKGLCRLKERLFKCYPDDFTNQAIKLLEDCSYITDGIEEFQEDIENEGKVVKKYGSIKFSCSLTEGLKLENLKLEDVKTIRNKVTFVNSIKSKISDMYTDMFDKETKKITEDLAMVEDARTLELHVASYIVQRLDSFSIHYRDFFEQLYFQVAFYRAAFNLYQRSKVIGLPICYPKVCRKEDFRFEELMEFSMAIYRKKCPVGNSANINNKLMYVITGACVKIGLNQEKPYK